MNRANARFIFARLAPFFEFCEFFGFFEFAEFSFEMPIFRALVEFFGFAEFWFEIFKFLCEFCEFLEFSFEILLEFLFEFLGAAVNFRGFGFEFDF